MARSIQGDGSAGYRLYSRAITQADTNTTVAAIEIPANTFIPPYGVSVYVVEVLAGGSPSLNVGDGSTADGWVDTADITETTVGCYTGSAANAAYSDTGKLYTSADTIDVAVSASLTNGTVYIIANCVDVSGLDLTAS